MNLDHLKEWINKFQTTRQHTHTPSSKVFKLSSWIWRHQSILFNIERYTKIYTFTHQQGSIKREIHREQPTQEPFNNKYFYTFLGHHYSIHLQVTSILNLLRFSQYSQPLQVNTIFSTSACSPSILYLSR